MKRRVFVSMTVNVELEIDDDSTSEWRGYGIEGAFADDERWEPDTDRQTKWLGLASEVGVSGRGLSSVDGWADFLDEAVRAVGWPEFYVDDVTEHTPTTEGQR